MTAPVKTLWFDDVARARPYHAALVPVPPGRRDGLTPHSHADFWELMCVLEGSGTHRVGRGEMPLDMGDLVLVRPHDRHELVAGGPQGMCFVNIAFPAATWRSFTDLLGIRAAATWEARSTPPQIALGQRTETVFAEFRRALEAYHRGAVHALDLARLWAVTLPILELTEGTPDEAGNRPAWLVRARAAMSAEDNLRQGLPRFLELAAVSHGHLARSMRTHYGCTPMEYIAEQRLAHAALLLTTTADTVSRIADRCGFASLSYFGRCFHARYGDSPRAYRRSAVQSVVPADT